MDEGAATGQDSFLPQHAGERLRSARAALKLDLAEIAARTRIPQRHLEAIENGNFAALPSATYATGFAKSYARAVGADEVAIAAQVRQEIAGQWNRPAAPPAYSIEEPGRGPSGALVWGGLIAAVLLIVGAGLWFGTNMFRGGSTPATVAAPAGEIAVPAAPPPPPAVVTPQGGQVTLTANDEVWVRVYDAADTTLLMKTMAPGERYDVPVDAKGPMINVGRPDKLAITVNGSTVPALGDGRVAIKDVPISAQALLARGQATPAPAQSGAAIGNASAAQ